MCIDKYGKDNVQVVTLDYGQKQKLEILKVSTLCRSLEIKHTILDLSVLGTIAQPRQLNISGTEIEMPNIKDVLGDPKL